MKTSLGSQLTVFGCFSAYTLCLRWWCCLSEELREPLTPCTGRGSHSCSPFTPPPPFLTPISTALLLKFERLKPQMFLFIHFVSSRLSGCPVHPTGAAATRVSWPCRPAPTARDLPRRGRTLCPAAAAPTPPPVLRASEARTPPAPHRGHAGAFPLLASRRALFGSAGRSTLPHRARRGSGRLPRYSPSQVETHVLCSHPLADSAAPEDEKRRVVPGQDRRHPGEEEESQGG